MNPDAAERASSLKYAHSYEVKNRSKQKERGGGQEALYLRGFWICFSLQDELIGRRRRAGQCPVTAKRKRRGEESEGRFCLRPLVTRIAFTRDKTLHRARYVGGISVERACVCVSVRELRGW